MWTLATVQVRNNRSWQKSRVQTILFVFSMPHAPRQLMLIIINNIKGFFCLLTSTLVQLMEDTTLRLENDSKNEADVFFPLFLLCLDDSCFSSKDHSLSQLALTTGLSSLVSSNCFFPLSLQPTLSIASGCFQPWGLKVLLVGFLKAYHNF